MSTTPEATSHHSSRKFSILLPLRAIQNLSFHYETPCNNSFLGSVKTYLHNQLLKFRYSKKATIIRPIFHFLFDITYLVSSNYKWKIDWPQFCDLLRISELYSKKLNCVDCRQLLGLNARKSCLWHVFLVYLVICGRIFFNSYINYFTI